MLGQRLLTALVLGPVVLAAALLGNPTLAIIAALAAFVAAGEASRLLGRSGFDVRDSLVEGIGAVAVILAAAVSVSAVVATIAILCGALLSLSLRSTLNGTKLYRWTDRFGAIVYSAIPLALLVLMRGWTGRDIQMSLPFGTTISLPYGAAWIGVVLSITWAVDSVAYIAGRAVGRHAFSPSISPKKTWEGTISGVAAGTVICALWAPSFSWNVAAGLALGFAASWAAVLGDLVESGLKRQSGLKDAGSILPGHGGLLDRIDSLAFCAIVVFLVRTVDGATHLLSLGSS